MGLRVVVCDRRHGRIDAVGGLRHRVGWDGAQFGSDAIEEGFPGGAEHTIGAHLGEALRQDVLEEAGDDYVREFLGNARRGLGA